MLAQYLASLRATNLRKSKKSVKAVNSPQVNKERTFDVHLLVKSFYIIFQIYILRQDLKVSLVLNLFLVFYQLSDSCIKKRVIACNIYT